VNLAAAEEWAGVLAQISNGNIDAKVVQLSETLETADTAQDLDPMPLQYTYWTSDYPDPADNVNNMYLQGGYYGSGQNWLVSYFASLPPVTPNDVVHVNGTTYSQAQVYTWMNGNITLADTSLDPAVRQEAYKIATALAIDMGLYVYVYQAQQLWYFRSWLKGYEMQENQILGGDRILLYYWLSK